MPAQTKPNEDKLLPLGQGINYTIKGNMLLMKINLAKDFGNTKGGNLRIASTLGNKPLDGDYSDVYVGLNIYKKIA